MTIARFLVMAALPAALLTGCAIDVREHREGATADVDVRSPLGDMHVRTNVDNADTGLPVYPNARPLREDREPESADVSIGGGLFGLRVVAAKFETDDDPADVAAYYRERMQAFGDVVECRGDVDFRGGRPHCRARWRSAEIQIVAGTGERHRLVSVKPRRAGSEFALVYVQAGRG